MRARGVEEAGGTVTIYGRGVESYRDTTKWLTAVLPVAAVVAAGVSLGERLVTTLSAAPSPNSWIQDYWLVALACGLFVSGIVAIIWTGTTVLSVEPTTMDDLLYGSGRKDLAKAVGAGAALPYYLDKASFTEELRAWDQDRADGSADASDPRAIRIAAATEVIRDWSVWYRMQQPFRVFRLAYLFGVGLIIAGLLLAPIQLGVGAAIEVPTQVLVDVEREGAASLRTTTGCTSATQSTFTAMGGTWDRPLLAVDGPDCRFAANWSPAPGHAEVRPVIDSQ